MTITDAIDIMESISGVTDESTPVGDAWNVILRYIHNPTPPPEAPADGEVAELVREGPSIDDIRQLCVDNELLMFVDSGDFDTVVVGL